MALPCSDFARWVFWMSPKPRGQWDVFTEDHTFSAATFQIYCRALQEEQLPPQYLHLQVLIDTQSVRKGLLSSPDRCRMVCDRLHYQRSSNQLFSSLNWSGTAKPKFRAAFPRRDYCKSNSGSVTSRNKSWVSPRSSGRCWEVQLREVRSQPSFQIEIKSEIKLKFRGWTGFFFSFLWDFYWKCH